MRSAKHYIDVGRGVSRRKLNMVGIGGSREQREKEWAAFEAEAVPLMPNVFRVANYLARDRRRFDTGNLEMKTTRVSASLPIIRKAARKLPRHSKHIYICPKIEQMRRYVY